MKKAFVLMPFKDPFDSYYRKIYRLALKSGGYTAFRVDELYGSRSILGDIQKSIKDADLILCDMSTKNPNVFYELGLAHAIGKPVILLANNVEDIPFDLRSFRAITYQPEEAGWEKKLYKDIARSCSEENLEVFPRPLVEPRGKAETASLESIGIVQIFDNIQNSIPEILEHIKTSDSVRIFLQLGKTVLDKKSSYDYSIYDYLEKHAKYNSNIKVLHAGVNNPYLGRRIALERGSNYDLWRADMEYAVKKIQALSKSSHAHVRSRQHMESYLWLIFLFDDIAYVQPYLFAKSNTRQAPVIKVTRNNPVTGEENPRSLYKIFSTYFDLKWEEYRPSKVWLEDIVEEDPNSRNSVVAIILKSGGRYLFVIPARYIAEGQNEIKFHAIGGKKEKGEDWLSAVNREVKEETNIDSVRIVSSRLTRYLTSSANLGSIEIENTPKPYCVYKRTQLTDSILPQKSTLWLVGYEVEVNDSDIEKTRPSREAACILFLTEEMLRRTLNDKVTIADVMSSRDGSKMIIREDITINDNARLIPSGLASIIATETDI